MTDDFVIETRDLCKEFRGFTAVKNINLRVRRGSIHALIGPNGAGKTTVFTLLTKFLTPTGGRIVYKGEEVTPAKPPDLARRGIGGLYRISAVFPHITVV